MSRVKKLKIITTVVTLLLILASCYMVLSGQTFYADIVAEKVRDAIKTSASLELSWDSIRGNPLTGVYVSNAKISSNGAVLASMDELGMRVALLSAASPNTRLSRLSFSGLKADYGDFAGLSLPQGESSGPPPVDGLYFSNSKLRTPWGELSVENGSVALGGSGFGVDLDGAFEGVPLSVRCETNMSAENALNLSSLKASFGDMDVTASGSLTPSLAVSGDVKKLDVEKLAGFLPFLKEYDLTGVYFSSFYVTNSNPSDIEGVEISGKLASGSARALNIPMREMAANFYYSKGYFQFRNAAVSIFNGKITGDIDLKLVSGDVPIITARVNSDSLETTGIKELLPWMENFAGTIDAASCDLAGPINSISAKAWMSSSAMNVASFPCSNVKANIVVNKASKVKVDFQGNIHGAPARGSGNISIGKNVDISADIAIPKISVASFRSNFPQLKEFNLNGDASVSVGVRGPANDLSFFVNLASSEMGVMDNYKLSNASAELLYAKNTLNVKSARMTWLDASLSAEGSVVIPHGNAPAKLTFKGGFSNLNIAKLGGIVGTVKDCNLGGVASGLWSLTGDSVKPIPHVEISLPKFFILGKYMLADVSATAEYSSPALNLLSSSFRLGASNITAAGSVTLPANGKDIEYNVKGSFKNLDPAAFVSMGLISQDISGNLTGDARIWKAARETEPSVRIFFKNSELNYEDEMDLAGLNGTLTYSKGSLQFDKLRTNLNTGSINLDGTVENILGWQKPESVPINLKATVTSADIDRIARIFNPASKGFQGLANGTAAIRGNLASPSYSAEGTLRAVRAFGLFLPVVNFSDVKGDKNRVEFPKVRAIVGRGFINASGSVNLSEDWDTLVTASGTSVDIRSLTVQLEQEMRREITGALDFNFKGSGPLSNFRGKGHGHIPNLSVFGIKMSDVDADVSIADGFLIVEDSSAKTYGGKFKGQMVKDLNRTSWGGRVDVTDADMASAFKDIAPGSEGSISGKANFSMRIAGDSRRTSMQDGSGKLEILDGEVSGFEGAKAVSKMIGGKPLRFHSALITFTLDGKTIYIIPGSRVSAPQEDPVYKYVTLDGSVTTEQDVDLSCMGNVNIRALNALAAGLQGVLTATIESGGVGDSSELLKNFLGNTITGFSRNEFRDVSLRVTGKPDDIKFSNIAVTAPVKIDTMPPALKNPDGYKEDTGIKLKVEIPVGPGGEGHAQEGVGGQIGGQILDQLIKGLIFGDD